jgi:3-oxo-5-alpha-steroid 4-dehydrogenase 3
MTHERLCYLTSSAWHIAELLVAPAYIALTISAALTLLSKPLESLSRHGKLTDKAQAIENDFVSRRRQRWHCWMRLQQLQVPKRLFAHFYVVGIMATISTLQSGLRNFDASHAVANDVIPPNKYAYPLSLIGKGLVPWILLIVHLLRRLYECCYVHEWNLSKSRMHIAGYLVGLMHYVCLPFCFLNFNMVDLEAGQAEVKSDFTLFLGLVLCCVGQVEQHLHHVILARLRSQRNEKHEDSNESNTHVRASKKTITISDPSSNKSYQNIGDNQQHIYSSTEYRLPRGRWFEYVSCPHYAAEILIYIGFILMFQVSSSGFVFVSDRDLLHTLRIPPNCDQLRWVSNCLFFMCDWKLTCLLIWVVTNLAISASRSHQWYKETFRDSFPTSRKALVPYLW